MNIKLEPPLEATELDKITGPPASPRTLRRETLMGEVATELFTKLAHNETAGGNDE